jgi:hypothetical protein
MLQHATTLLMDDYSPGLPWSQVLVAQVGTFVLNLMIIPPGPLGLASKTLCFPAQQLQPTSILEARLLWLPAGTLWHNCGTHASKMSK